MIAVPSGIEESPGSKSSVMDNIHRYRASGSRIRATETMFAMIYGGSETGNLHAEQG